MMKESLTPFRIVRDGGLYIINMNTGTKGAVFKDCPSSLKRLKRIQARLNSSYALDKMGIY
tara:strand:+ start:277 stop:459 length:183 start_codon:yes stop_codon:yes gene_type:complete